MQFSLQWVQVQKRTHKGASQASSKQTLGDMACFAYISISLKLMHRIRWMEFSLQMGSRAKKKKTQTDIAGDFREKLCDMACFACVPIRLTLINRIFSMEFSLQTSSIEGKKAHKTAAQAISKKTLCCMASFAYISVSLKLINRSLSMESSLQAGSRTKKKSAWHAIPSKPLARWLVFLCISIILCIEFSLQTGSRAKKNTQTGIAGDLQANPLRHGLFGQYIDKAQIDKTHSFHEIFVANGSEGLKGKGIASDFQANSSRHGFFLPCSAYISIRGGNGHAEDMASFHIFLATKRHFKEKIARVLFARTFFCKTERKPRTLITPHATLRRLPTSREQSSRPSKGGTHDQSHELVVGCQR